MKKKLLVAAIIVLAVLFAGYRYLYRGHRDIAKEDADFALTTSQLLSEFSANDSLANAKYADKTITVSGKVTDVEAEAGTIMIDEKLSVGFQDAASAKQLKTGQQVKLKGRFVGYDDLLEELKMDQSTLTE
ncbi:hypothetical protein HUK80_13980 [Flavobacterium sp. MAH-1]|uniref:tRNA_anti-like n=1 Tax=Flavobacterium agri TaxID=2743471 RepID=A0A7Y9C822_9FLAO|nr:hypothetical protein [Flavobacterium agri]NUY82009.1 hypothetical protein [Flavobacterium agri]NYA72033.1 hypothetical protein [Flavobacterium agri]